jgi:PKD repeat protein
MLLEECYNYVWNFGDANTATGVTPTHTYAQDGTYTIILTVAFACDLTSYDGIAAWDWDFDNDGVTDSTEQNPTYEYAEDGVYTVKLTVYESDGVSDTMTKADYITVTKANNAPYEPANPSPSDGATDVSIDKALSWTGGDPDDDDTVTFDVYFGTETNQPLIVENQQGTTYDPGTLDYGTEYYWRIVATDNNGASSEGEVWVFTTVATPNDPPHGPVKRSLLKVKQMP